jgi:hypothetical protein
VVHQQEFLQDLVGISWLYIRQEVVMTYNSTEQGVEKKVELDNLSSSDVAAKVAQLLSIA